jgi:hypothetical protein
MAGGAVASAASSSLPLPVTISEGCQQKTRNFRPAHGSVWEKEERPVRSAPFEKSKASAEMTPCRT